MDQNEARPRVDEDEEQDVEGHSMLPDPSISRTVSQAREQEIQRHLKRHSLEDDARRSLNPFRRGR